MKLKTFEVTVDVETLEPLCVRGGWDLMPEAEKSLQGDQKAANEIFQRLQREASR
jgi:hypothetical protein